MRHIRLAAAATAAIGFATVATHAADTGGQEQRLAALQQRLAQLEADEQARQLATNLVDVLSAQVLADAHDRSQLMAVGGFVAGWDGSFMLQSADGRFVLEPGFHFQFRSITNFREVEAGGDDEWESVNGFELRRAKPDVQGNIFSPDFKYYFLLDISRSTGNVQIEQAWGQYKFAEDWVFRFGQFVLPVFKEQLTSSKRQLTVERSLVNAVITDAGQALSQGVEAIYTGDKYGLAVAYHDGWQELNSAVFEDDPSFGVSARGELFVFGNRKLYTDYSANGNEKTLLALGVAGDFTQYDDADIWRYTADVQFENETGLGIFAAAYFRTTDGDAEEGTDYGLLLQANQMLGDNWEVYGQYGLILLDEDLLADAGDEDAFNLFVIGVTRYLEGQAAKVTLDAVWLPDGSPTNDTGSGILFSEEDQIVIRGQFQLLL